MKTEKKIRKKLDRYRTEFDRIKKFHEIVFQKLLKKLEEIKI